MCQRTCAAACTAATSLSSDDRSAKASGVSHSKASCSSLSSTSPLTCSARYTMTIIGIPKRRAWYVVTGRGSSRTASPDSSATSRSAASAGSSPGSTLPEIASHRPGPASLEADRRMASISSPRKTIAHTATTKHVEVESASTGTVASDVEPGDSVAFRAVSDGLTRTLYHALRVPRTARCAHVGFPSRCRTACPGTHVP